MLRGSAIALAAGVALAALSTAATAAVTPAAWRPISAWNVYAAGERCSVARSYASAVTIGFEAHPMGGATVRIEMPGKALRMEGRAIEADFGTGSHTRYAVFRRSAKANHVLYRFGVTRDELMQIARHGQLAASADDLKLDAPMGGLAAAVNRLDACVSDLLARWGLSKADQARLARLPERGESQFFNAESYPDDALRRNAIGSVAAVMTVHPDGSVSDCRIVRTSGHADIDQSTCRSALRMRMKPAVDRGGKPMRSPYYIEVIWMMDKTRFR